ncbi:hypothetical protein TeGR_g8414, partial [Tetraparma gracilis]
MSSQQPALLETPRSASISSAFLSHVAITASQTQATMERQEKQNEELMAQLKEKQEQMRQAQEMQKQQAQSLKILQEQLQAFIRAKQSGTPPDTSSSSSSTKALDTRLQQVQQTQADKKTLEASMEYGDKINELRREIEQLKAEKDGSSASSSSSSSSFVYGLMELLLILQPNLVINAISSPSFELKPHYTNHPNSTLLFADISGYTALAQSLGAAGAEGTEALSSALDQFFGIAISSIYHFGGDVVKFCGDAILCVFSPNRTVSPSQAAMQAVRCSLELKKKLRFFKAGEVELDLKQMLAYGTIVGNFVGDKTLNHFEFLTTGQPIKQIADAEHFVNPGDIILSPEMHSVVSDKVAV